MIGATAAFFAGAGPLRWHLDLHTAIRPSVYPTFAVVPDLVADQPKAALVGWLGQAAIGAIIMNPQSAGTYSYYSAEHHGAAASTVELGRVGTLGQNDLSLFADVATALDDLLRGAAPAAAKAAAARVQGGAGDHQADRRFQDGVRARDPQLHRARSGRGDRHRRRHRLPRRARARSWWCFPIRTCGSACAPA